MIAIEIVLLKILEAIDYSDNKEDFIRDFSEGIQLQALASAIESLPTDEQNIIQTKLADADDAQEVLNIMHGYFTQEQTTNTLEKTAGNMIMEYISAISPTLSTPQREKLVHVLQELQANDSK